MNAFLWYDDPNQGVQLFCGDCREVMAEMEAELVDAVVCDPPYGINFMGKGWDHGVPGAEFWAEAFRVTKPGGHLLAFGGTRTYHRLACAIEDAGWELRDCLSWLYGSGFPKSLDVSKAIDKAAGVEREVVGSYRVSGNALTPTKDKGGTYGVGVLNSPPGYLSITVPATSEAQQWDGWGTALKPAWEPIILARKPLVGNVAQNVLAYGTGGLNIDGCRIEGVKGVPASPRRAAQNASYGELGNDPGNGSGWNPDVGRWPANVVLDEVAATLLDAQTGGSGGVSRFYYVAKASRSERERGLESDVPVAAASEQLCDLSEKGSVPSRVSARHNIHPTVKPIALMRWLVRLVTPPDGLVLDPFVGSGSTMIAACLEGVRCAGIDTEEAYLDIAAGRINAWS